MALDCQRCGACCVNPRVNRAEGFSEYVEVTSRDRELLRHKHLIDRYTVAKKDGTRHLRVSGPDQRCTALLGGLGRTVHCAIYAVRPQPCRWLEPGSPECLDARRGLGLEGDP